MASERPRIGAAEAGGRRRGCRRAERRSRHRSAITAMPGRPRPGRPVPDVRFASACRDSHPRAVRSPSPRKQACRMGRSPDRLDRAASFAQVQATRSSSYPAMPCVATTDPRPARAIDHLLGLQACGRRINGRTGWRVEPAGSLAKWPPGSSSSGRQGTTLDEIDRIRPDLSPSAPATGIACRTRCCSTDQE